MERETREPQGGESNWYYLRDDETIGPLPAAELRRLFRAGKLGAETLVWRAGMKDWVPASTLGVTATATPAPPPPPGKRATPVASPQAELPESEADRRNAGRIAKSRRHAKKKRLQVLAVVVLAVIAIVLSGVAVVVLWPPSNGDSTTTADSNGAAVSSAAHAAAKSSGADVGSKRTPPRSDATPRERDEDRRADDTSPPEATPRDPADRDLDDREMLASEEMFRRDPPASDRSSDDLEPPVAEPTGMGPGGIGPGGIGPGGIGPGGGVKLPVAGAAPATSSPAAGLPPVDAPALLYQRVEVFHDLSYEILTTSIPDKSRFQILSKLELSPRAADGSREVSQVIEQTRLELAGDTTRELYESELRDLIGQQYTFTLNSRDEVIKFTGFGGRPASAPVTRSGMEGFASVTVIDQDGWKEIAQLSFLQPDRSIAAGQPWTRPMTHDFNELGSWQGTTTFTLQGPEGAGTRYNYVHDMTYHPPKGGPGLLPFDVSDADFKATKAEGSFVFDPTHGHVTDVRETFEMEGSLGASMLAGAATVKLREHQELTIQLSRQNPWTSSASTPSPLPTPTPAR
jgi:hypothetical protein